MAMIEQPDIEVPVVEIVRGWTVDEIETLDDCDDAFAVLTGAICSIESQIEEAQEAGKDRGEWFRRLKTALRWKKAALQIVQTKKGRITRAARAEAQKAEDRRLLSILSARYPAEFDAALQLLRAGMEDA